MAPMCREKNTRKLGSSIISNHCIHLKKLLGDNELIYCAQCIISGTNKFDYVNKPLKNAAKSHPTSSASPIVSQYSAFVSKPRKFHKIVKMALSGIKKQTNFTWVWMLNQPCCTVVTWWLAISWMATYWPHNEWQNHNDVVYST